MGRPPIGKTAMSGRERMERLRLKRFGDIQPTLAELLAKQNHACGICGERFSAGRKTYLDHCHDTRVGRGVLCSRCNTGIGYFKDDSARLRRAADYLDCVTSPNVTKATGAEIAALTRELAQAKARIAELPAENFSDKGKLRIEDAVRIHTARLNKQFEQRVNEEVRRRIDAADDATRAQNKQLSQQLLFLTQMVGQRAVFTETQYRQMLILCHPDSSAGPKLKAELLQVLIENKIRLIKPAYYKDKARRRR